MWDLLKGFYGPRRRSKNLLKPAWMLGSGFGKLKSTVKSTVILKSVSLCGVDDTLRRLVTRRARLPPDLQLFENFYWSMIRSGEQVMVRPVQYVASTLTLGARLL